MEYLDLKNCPLCGKHLQLKQINFTTAMFICMDVKCPYPVNEDCMVVQRTIANINKTVDLLGAYKKDKHFESNMTVSETTENFTERSLMLDLEELLNKQSDYHCFSEIETKGEVPFQDSEETDFPLKFETDSQNSQSYSLELPELDDFLVDLLR